VGTAALVLFLGVTLVGLFLLLAPRTRRFGRRVAVVGGVGVAVVLFIYLVVVPVAYGVT
jgi:hypothetical protein